MKIFIHYPLITILIISLHSGLYAQEYTNTAAKDFLADAPWRVKSSDAKIPIILTIKDANSDDCILDTLQIWIFDKVNNRDSIIHKKLFGGQTVNIARWEYIHEVSVNDLINQPFNLTISEFDTLKFRVRLSFRDNISPEYFTQSLRVFLGNSNLSPFENWYVGDTHFHSEFTNNLYEFGSTVRATSKAASALGLDWLTITDHSCDFPPVGVGFQPLQDSINLYNGISSCLMIRGEEVTIDNDNTNNLVDDKIHLLVYNKGLFIRGPENYFTFTNDNSGTLTTLNTALTQNVNGIAYASHPYDEMDIFLGGSLIGNLLSWSSSNFNTALQFRNNFRGLEFWNTKELFTKTVSEFTINPFPFNQNSENKSAFYKSHLNSAETNWIELLRNDLNAFTSDKKLFGLAGSDAHGDLNYQTYGSTSIIASDNAIAKVRTLAYLPNGNNIDNVLLALKNGNTMLSDGPVLIFNIDLNGDGVIDNQFGNDLHIGDDNIFNYMAVDSNKVKILLRWHNSDEFGGNIKRFLLHYITKDSVKEFLLNGHFGIEESMTGSSWISLKDLQTEFNFSLRLDEYSLIKFSAYTQDSLFRCYTNPIWLKIEKPVGINIHLTTFIEGFVNPELQAMNCQDTILVELRNAAQPYNKVDSARVLFDTLGRSTVSFRNAETGNYYLVIKHRNSIETWSKPGGENLINGTISSYDFTLSSSQSFGNNLKQIGNSWCIYSGDVNQDGIVDLNDLVLIDDDIFNLTTGYKATDVNGDLIINFLDLQISNANCYDYVMKNTP